MKVKHFVFLYILYLAIAFFLVDYAPMREALHIESFYNDFVASLSTWFIDLLGIAAKALGDAINLPHATLIIKFGCNGLEAIFIYVAGVLAYPAQWKMKLGGILLGSLVLEILNIFRIALLAYTIEHYPRYFDLMHDYITQSIMIVLAFLTFLFYLQRVSGEKQAP